MLNTPLVIHMHNCFYCGICYHCTKCYNIDIKVNQCIQTGEYTTYHFCCMYKFFCNDLSVRPIKDLCRSRKEEWNTLFYYSL